MFEEGFDYSGKEILTVLSNKKLNKGSEKFKSADWLLR